MKLVGCVAMSHSPSWDMQPLEGDAKPYVDAVFRARGALRAINPDLIVVFGPDHVRNFFFDVMPAFCIGIEAVEGFGDYTSPAGPMPTAPPIARAIAERVMGDGFDPALSHRMGIDHGISQPYAALVPDLATPMLPIMISTAGPPMPSLARCHAFGASVGRAIRALPGEQRVVVVGSGGLSHSPPSVSPADPAVSPDTRDYVINGRDRVAEFNAARERSSTERRKQGGTGPVNDVWDRWFLDRIMQGDLDPILALDDATLLDAAGVGGQEVRGWIAALGAWGRPIDTSDYAPVPAWITGMGCISAFERETA
jgi:2,3-dihydroxyphenylpropionate 1,2-dioxygenase